TGWRLPWRLMGVSELHLQHRHIVSWSAARPDRGVDAPASADNRNRLELVEYAGNLRKLLEASSRSGDRSSCLQEKYEVFLILVATDVSTAGDAEPESGARSRPSKRRGGLAARVPGNWDAREGLSSSNSHDP